MFPREISNIIEIVLLFVNMYMCKSTFSTRNLIELNFRIRQFISRIVYQINHHKVFD